MDRANGDGEQNSKPTWLVFEQKVDRLFFGRESLIEEFQSLLAKSDRPSPLINIHGVTGTGKSFLTQRLLQIGREQNLPTVKIQFDGKDREESVPIGQHHEILRQIVLRLGVPTPRFATAYLAWSLSREIGGVGEPRELPLETQTFIGAGISEIINFLVTSSLGPGGLLVAATKAGWRFVAERVSVEPLEAFAKSKEGRQFAEELKRHRMDEIPSQLGRFLAKDLSISLSKMPHGGPRAIIAFDSWEQFEERYPERRSRWYEELQIVEFFYACREFIQFVIIGQRPVSWLSEDRSLKEDQDIRFINLQGLERRDAAGYLRERRGIASDSWITAMLNATAESGSGQGTKHHALSLGMIADTATEILARNPDTDAHQLAVRPNDLEDLVRRFLSVREELEPAFERLALTPRFDDRAIALALGKPYDEFTAMTDFEAMLKLSFIERLDDSLLSMHGLMRKILRDRMQRYSPNKIRAGHSSWRRHYSERAIEGLEFRHALGVDPAETLATWSRNLNDALKTGNTKRHAELTEIGIESEDELAHLPNVDAAKLCLVWAEALRKCSLGHRLGQLAQAMSLTDRSMILLSGHDEPELYARITTERGRINILWAETSSEVERFGVALGEFEVAVRTLDKVNHSFEWAKIQLDKSFALTNWGRMTADASLIQRSIEASQDALHVVTQDADPEFWADTQVSIAMSLEDLGHITEDSKTMKAAIEVLKLALSVYTPEANPKKWANGNWTLGRALRGLADFEGGTAALSASVDAYGKAGVYYTRDRDPAGWARLQVSTSNSLVEWGMRDSNVEILSKAIRFCTDGLHVVTKESAGLLWSLLWGNLAKAQRFLADIEGNPTLYEEAARGFRNALEARSKESTPFYWAIAKVNLADTLLNWCLVSQSRERLLSALGTFQDALEVVSETTMPASFAAAVRGIERAQGMLEELDRHKQ